MDIVRTRSSRVSRRSSISKSEDEQHSPTFVEESGITSFGSTHTEVTENSTSGLEKKVTEANANSGSLVQIVSSREKEDSVGESGNNRSRQGGSSFSGMDASSFASDVVDNTLTPFVSEFSMKCVAAASQGVFVPFASDVAVMFVDMSGYSKISAELASQGAHKLFDAVNTYFEKIIYVTQKYQGDVISFAGDAMLAIFSKHDLETNCRLASCCAITLQTQYGKHEVSGASVDFTLHIGISAGAVHADVLWNPSSAKNMQEAYLFVGGPALAAVEPQVNASKSGEICIGKNVRRLISRAKNVEFVTDKHPSEPDCYYLKDVVEKGCDLAKLISARQSVDNIRGIPVSAAIMDEADRRTNAIESKFVHPLLRQRLYDGQQPMSIAEIRNLCVLFIKKDSAVPVSTWFSELQLVLDERNCPIIQVIEDDKGVHVIAAHNLFVAEQDVAMQGVLTCRAIVAHDVDCFVGASVGQVFCGVVGSEIAARWDITGEACVRACRLMQEAEAVGLRTLIDDTVFAGTANISEMELLRDDLMLKGWKQPSRCYVLSSHSVNAVGQLIATGTICEQLNKEAVDAISSVVMRKRPVEAALVTGEYGSGKKTVMMRAIKNTRAVPFLHETAKNRPRLQLAESMGWWFANSREEELRDRAAVINKAMKDGKYLLAHKAAFDLIDAAIRLKEEVACIVAHAEIIDKPSLTLIRETMEAFNTTRHEESLTESAEDHALTSGSSTPQASPRDESGLISPSRSRGRWLWLMTHTPLYGQSSADVVVTQLNAAGKIPICTLFPMRLKMTAALWNANAAWLCSDTAAESFHRKTGGNPACMMEVWGLMRRTTQKIMQLKKQGQKVKPMGRVASYGVMHFSDEGKANLFDKDWGTIAPAFCSKLQQAYDVLPPAHQLLLRVLAAADADHTGLPVALIHRASRHFRSDDELSPAPKHKAFRMNSEATNAAIMELVDMLLLRFVGESCVAFRTPAMHAVVEKLIPPSTKLKINVYCFDRMVREHRKEMSAYFIKVAGLAERANLMDAYKETMNTAWKTAVKEAAAQSSTELPTDGGVETGSVGGGLVFNTSLVKSSAYETAIEANEAMVEVQRCLAERKIEIAGIPPFEEEKLDFGKYGELPVAIMQVKNYMPPLILGPIRLMLLALARRIVHQFLSFTRGKDTGKACDPAPCGTLLYAVKLWVLQGKASPEEAVEQCDLLEDVTATVTAVEESVAKAEKFLKWTTEYIAPLAKHFRARLELMVDPPPRTIQGEAPLVNALKLMPQNPTWKDFNLALVQLAVVRFDAPFPLMEPTKILEEWAKNRNGDPTDFRGYLFVTTMALSANSVYGNEQMMKLVPEPMRDRARMFVPLCVPAD